MRAWARRTVELHRELAAIAAVEPRWWLLAGGVALVEPWAPPEMYLACDAEPDADTLMGYPATPPRDLVADAIARARAARVAVRELDGQLPAQPLAITIERRGDGAALSPSALDVAAFACGGRCLVAPIDAPDLAAQLTSLVIGEVGLPPPPAPPWSGAAPFVCVSIGGEPLETARHGHRRGWTERGGPWLGLGRAGELAVVSTCHLVIDGYGHARLTARIAELTGSASGGAVGGGAGGGAGEGAGGGPGSRRPGPVLESAPPVAAVAGALPLAVAWRELRRPTPRAIPMAYELGRILHRHAGRRAARFSPTFQIPVARGHKDDPLRLRHRIVAATASVRFSDGVAEPYAAFEARLRQIIAREAAARGLVSRLLAAARAVPVPVAWKRRSISAKRPAWLDSFAEVIGGRAMLSRIVVDAPVPRICAVSSPARLATAADPIGSCVITIVDGGDGPLGATRAAMTVCGSGLAGTSAGAAALLDELLAAAPEPRYEAMPARRPVG